MESWWAAERPETHPGSIGRKRINDGPARDQADFNSHGPWELSHGACPDYGKELYGAIYIQEFPEQK